MDDEGKSDSNWRRFFEAQDQEATERAVSDAKEAEYEWAKRLGQLQALPPSVAIEASKTDVTKESLIDFAEELSQRHKTTGKNKVQNCLGVFCKLVNQYSPIVDAIADATPYGAGTTVWNAFKAVLTFVDAKNLFESQLDDALTRVVRNLPRADAYQQIYPTMRMLEFMSRLHKFIFSFIEQLIMYYADRKWTGSVKRFFKTSTTLPDALSGVIQGINEATRDIEQEGILGLCAEMRSTRETVEIVDRKVVRVHDDLSKHTKSQQNLPRVVDKIRTNQYHDHVRKSKTKFVPETYEAEEVLQVARRQVERLGWKNTQEQAFRDAIVSPDILQWHRNETDQLSNGSGKHSSENNEKRLLVLCSSSNADPTISNIAFALIDRLHDHVILHSMHQNEKPQYLHSETRQDEKRTVADIYREAIYQLLSAEDGAVSSDLIVDHLKDLQSDAPIDTIYAFLRILILTICAPTEVEQGPLSPSVTEKEPRKVLWVIDRLDECRMNHGTGGMRLTGFVQNLQRLIVASHGRLKIVLVSTYELKSLDRGWDSEVIHEMDPDEDEPQVRALKETWSTYEYSPKRRRH